MPILVDEVVISVEVDNRAAGGAGAPSGAGGAGGAGGAAGSTDDKQALIAECVERVLDILAQRQER